MNDYAMILLTCEPSDLQNPKEALRFAVAACEHSNHEDPDWLDTLALAYHRTGQTAKAIETQKKAIACLGERPVRASFEERLAEYE